VMNPDGIAAMNNFFIGSNTAAETGTSYISSAPCGITDPTPTDGLIPGLIMHIVYNVDGSCPSATPTPTPSATASPSASPSVTPSPTATPSATPSPSATPTPSATPAGCVLGFGFWKNHPEDWPVTQLQLGNVTYTQDQLLSIMHEPVRGNGLVS